MAACLAGLGRYGRLVILLVFLIVVLQGLHMMILMKIEGQKSFYHHESFAGFQPREQFQQQEYNNGSKSSSESHQWQLLLDKILSSPKMDSSGQYMIVPNLVPSQSTQSKDVNDVTLCSQATSNHLYHLTYLSNIWHGPISVTVFTSDRDIQFTVQAIIHLKHCFESVAKHVTFHLAFPISNTLPGLKGGHIPYVDCSNFEFLKSKGSKINYEILGIEYPHNFLRNIALEYAKSLYVFVIDIDMVPSKNLRSQFKDFIHRKGMIEQQQKADENITFVVPSFESRSQDFPDNKRELLSQWAQSVIRPFYWEVCWKCQKPTGYDQWKELPNLDFLDVGYSVDWVDPWEPFYITKKTMPRYDERFKQYGFNRISQVCELHVAGFQFVILNNAFVIHKGFKSRSSFHSSKDEEQEKNKQLFRDFKSELKTRYSWSDRSC